MALSLIEQIQQTLKDKKNILIVFRRFLEKMGKRTDIVSDNFVLPRTMKFLQHAETIKTQFSHLRQFIITIDAHDAGVQELSYDLKDGKLRIYITPKQGFYSREHLSTGQSNFKYDLIITLDTPDLKSLGSLYESYSEFFYKTPIINIDRHSENEQYGQINFVDLTAMSSAELLYRLMNTLGPEFIDVLIATALLTAIIVRTRSFKADNVTPQTLDLASKLIGLGADRDFIVHNLFRTRSVAALKLWGQALTHLQTEPDLGLVWTSVTKEDLQRSGAAHEDIGDIIDELIINSPEAKITLLLAEDPKDTGTDYILHGTLVTEKGFDAKKILKNFTPSGSANYATFLLKNIPLQEAQEKVRKEIREALK